MRDLIIIIPVYNEEKIIKNTILELRKRIRQEYSLVLVDDYSSDSTYRVIKQISLDTQNIKLLSNRYKKGFGYALRTGIEVADSDDIIVIVMADLCDEIELIPQMYNKIIEGNDIVSASRYIKGGRREGGPILKALLSRYSSCLIHKISRIPLTDLTNSFKAYHKKALENISIESTGFEISMEIVLKAYLKGYKIVEIPTKWRERTDGESHFAIIRDGIKFIRWFIFGLLLPFLKIFKGGSNV